MVGTQQRPRSIKSNESPFYRKDNAWDGLVGSPMRKRPVPNAPHEIDLSAKDSSTVGKSEANASLVKKVKKVPGNQPLRRRRGDSDDEMLSKRVDAQQRGNDQVKLRKRVAQLETLLESKNKTLAMKDSKIQRLRKLQEANVVERNTPRNPSGDSASIDSMRKQVLKSEEKVAQLKSLLVKANAVIDKIHKRNSRRAQTPLRPAQAPEARTKDDQKTGETSLLATSLEESIVQRESLKQELESAETKLQLAQEKAAHFEAILRENELDYSNQLNEVQLQQEALDATIQESKGASTVFEEYQSKLKCLQTDMERLRKLLKEDATRRNTASTLLDDDGSQTTDPNEDSADRSSLLDFQFSDESLYLLDGSGLVQQGNFTATDKGILSSGSNSTSSQDEDIKQALKASKLECQCLKDVIEDLEQQLDSREVGADMTAEMNELKARLQAKEVALADFEIEVNELQMALRTSEEQCDSLTDQTTEFNERSFARNDDESARLLKRIDEMERHHERTIKELETELRSTKSSLDDSRASCRTLGQELADVKNKVEEEQTLSSESLQSTRTEVSNTKALASRLENEIADLEEDLLASQQSRERIAHEKALLEEELEELKDRTVREMNEDAHEMELLLHSKLELQTELDSLRNEMSQQQKQAEEESRANQGKMNEAKRYISRIENEMKSLKAEILVSKQDCDRFAKEKVLAEEHLEELEEKTEEQMANDVKEMELLLQSKLELQTELDSLRRELDKQLNESELANAKQSVSHLESEVDGLKVELLALQQESERAVNDRVQAEEQLTDLMEKSEQQMAKNSTEKETLLQTNLELKAELASVRDTMEQQMKETEETCSKSSVVHLESEIDSLKAKLVDLQQECERAVNEKGLVEEQLGSLKQQTKLEMTKDAEEMEALLLSKLELKTELDALRHAMKKRESQEQSFGEEASKTIQSKDRQIAELTDLNDQLQSLLRSTSMCEDDEEKAKLKNDAKDMETNMLALQDELFRVTEHQKNVDAARLAAEASLHELNSKHDADRHHHEQRMSALETSLDVLRQEKEELQTTKEELAEETRILCCSLDLANDRIESVEQEKQGIVERINDSGHVLKRIEREKSELDALMSDVKSELERTRCELEEKEEELGIAQQTIQTMKKEASAHSNDDFAKESFVELVATLRKDLSAAQSRADFAEKRVKKLENAAEENGSHNAVNELKQKVLENDRLQEEVFAMQDKLIDSQSTSEGLREEMQYLRAKLSEVTEAVNANSAEDAEDLLLQKCNQLAKAESELASIRQSLTKLESKCRHLEQECAIKTSLIEEMSQSWQAAGSSDSNVKKLQDDYNQSVHQATKLSIELAESRMEIDRLNGVVSLSKSMHGAINRPSNESKPTLASTKEDTGWFDNSTRSLSRLAFSLGSSLHGKKKQSTVPLSSIDLDAADPSQYDSDDSDEDSLLIC